VNFSYANRRAAYLGETLTATGEVIAKDKSSRTVEVRLGIRNETGEIIAPGSAKLKFE
jgi:3-methylfumaryl-CoA hydratase